jgi:hypothetical protein
VIIKSATATLSSLQGNSKNRRKKSGYNLPLTALLLASPRYSTHLKGKSLLSKKEKEKKQRYKVFLLSSLFVVLVLVVIHAMLLW